MIKKALIFTDIHWGRRGNDRVHNQDCIDFITWFCNIAKRESPSHIVFMGDWFECRNAINTETMEYSYRGLKLLDALDVPIMFIVGNHDLYRRTTRDVHSVNIFQELKNVTIIDHPVIIDGSLFSPYLFEHEYQTLSEHSDVPVWFGHFEFQGFAITGHNTILEHGPSHTNFKKQKRIFSGHFHKRQQKDNVVYIGNAFPADMGDSGDNDRGCAIYEFEDDLLRFENWIDCPKYLKTSLTCIMADQWTPSKKLRVKCIVDEQISYTEAQDLRDALIKEHGLRDFILEENREQKQEILEGSQNKVDAIANTHQTIDEIVRTQLLSASSDPLFSEKYNIQKLIDLYDSLKIAEKEGEYF